MKPQISPVVRPKKCDINYLLHSQPEPSTPMATVVATQPKVHIPYPSPTLSPVFTESKPNSEVSSFTLPPIYSQTTNFKLKTVM